MRALVLTIALAAAAVGAAACGGSGDGGGTLGATATVQRYFSAVARGDASGACREFTPESREKLAEFGAEHLGVKPPSCSGVVSALLASEAGAGLKKLGHARVTAVEREKDAVRVSVAGLDRPTEVVRDAGAWRIRSEPTGETD
jgi:hypothetical protein